MLQLDKNTTATPITSASETHRQYYPGLDLLRAAAAALVVVFHIISIGKITDLPSGILFVIFRYGWVGVDLFLVISGFVIALSAFSGVKRDGPDFRRSFAVRRLARIVPLYLITCAAFIALIKPQYMFVSGNQLITHIGSHLLFIHNLFASTHGSINGPTWSIGLEMQFYLLVMCVAPWLIRQGAVLTLFGALAAGCVWRFMTTLVWVPGSAPEVIQFIYLTQLPGTIDQFAFGIALAIAVSRNSAFAKRCLKVGWRPFVLWSLISSVLLAAAGSAITTHHTWTNVTMLVGWRPLLGAGFAAALAAAITLPIAANRILAPFRYLGTISYGIYLWHMLVIISVVSWVPGISATKLVVACTMATLVLASLSWHLIEKPNINLYKAS